jgi:DNA-binding transcriptional ArsR family regulator
MDTELAADRLKALAHPLRLRLVELLRTHGPATATELARRVGGVTSGTTSWHLRRLADHGFVRETPEQVSGRERRWQAAQARTTLDADLLIAPATRAATQALLQELLGLQVGWLRAWLAQAAEWDPAWVHAAAFSDRLMWLTPARLTELVTALRAVLDDYEHDATAPDEDARPVAVLLHAFPRVDVTGEPAPSLKPGSP